MGVARCSLQLVSRWSQHSPGEAGLGLQRGTSWGGGGEQTQLGLEQGWGRVSDTPAPNRNSPRGSLTTWEAQAARLGAQLPSLAGPRPALQTCRADPRRWGSSTAGLPTGRPSGARSWYKAGFVRPRGRASQASVTLRVACGFPRRGGPFRMKFPSRNTSCRRGCPAPPGKDTLCSEIPAGLAPWTWQGEACPLLPAGTNRPVVPEPPPGLAATASENQPMSSPKLATCTGVGPFCPFQHLHSVDVNSKFMSHWHVGVPGPGIEATPHSNPSHSSDNAGSFTL